MSKHKYGAKPTVVDNIRFASKAEAKRYGELKLLEKAGEIDDLELQPKYPLTVYDKKLGTYIADFRYRVVKNQTVPLEVVEDVKGFKTPVYQLKKRLMRAIYGIEITEVSR